MKPIRASIFKILGKYIEDMLIEQLASFLYENTSTWNDIGKITMYGIIGSLREGLLAEIAEAQLNRLFNGFYSKIRVAGIVLALPAAFEIGFYSFKRRKRQISAKID
jgi:hypothetical protein